MGIVLQKSFSLTAWHRLRCNSRKCVHIPKPANNSQGNNCKHYIHNHVHLWKLNAPCIETNLWTRHSVNANAGNCTQLDYADLWILVRLLSFQCLLSSQGSPSRQQDRVSPILHSSTCPLLQQYIKQLKQWIWDEVIKWFHGCGFHTLVERLKYCQWWLWKYRVKMFMELKPLFFYYQSHWQRQQ